MVRETEIKRLFRNGTGLKLATGPTDYLGFHFFEKSRRRLFFTIVKNSKAIVMSFFVFFCTG